MCFYVQIQPPLVIQRYSRVFCPRSIFIICPQSSANTALLNCCFPGSVSAAQKLKNWAWCQGYILNLSYSNRHWQWQLVLIVTARRSFVLDEHHSSRPAKVVIWPKYKTQPIIFRPFAHRSEDRRDGIWY